MTRITVALLSGGIDSCVAATIAKQEGDELYLLSVDWGQRQRRELGNARRIGEYLSPQAHQFVDFSDYSKLSWSALTSKKPIPEHRTLEQNMEDTPDSYPPGRDPFLRKAAASWLESIMLHKLDHGQPVDAGRLIIGTNYQDQLVYPDCLNNSYELENQIFKTDTSVSSRYGIPFTVETPLITLTKKGVIAKGYEIGAPIHLTRSCYDDKELQCGVCDPCRIIYFALQDMGIENPFRYDTIPAARHD